MSIFSRARTLGSNLGAAAVEVVTSAPAAARVLGGAARAAVALPERQPPEGYAALFALVAPAVFSGPPDAASVPLDAERYLAERLAREGHDPELHNFGLVRCLAAHEHGAQGDDRCAPRVAAGGARVWARRYPDDAAGLRRLLVVALYRSGAALPAPLCSGCGEHDAERRGASRGAAEAVSGARADGLGNVVDDLSTAWDICKVCRKIGANVGAAGSEAEYVVADEAGDGNVDTSAPLADDGVGGYHSRDPNDTAADPPTVSGDLPDLGDEDVGYVVADDLGSSDPIPYLDAQNPEKRGLAKSVLGRLAKYRVFVALPGETLPLNSSPVDPADVSNLLLETPSNPRYGSLSLGQARLFTPPKDTPEGGTGAAEVAPQMGGTLAELAEGWAKVVATRDASPPGCACREKTAPLIAEWQETLAKGHAITPRTWANLRAAQAAQSAAALLPPEGGDFALDVRTEAEFKANPRPGAVNVPLADLLARLSIVAPATKDSLGAPPGARVVVFCKSGARADQAMRLLRMAGYHACSGHAESCPIMGEAPGDPGPLGDEEIVVLDVAPEDEGRAPISGQRVGVSRDGGATWSTAVSGIEEARVEVATKSRREIDAAMAATWTDRAVASLERYAEAREAAWLVRAANDAHEAVEHGAEAGDAALARVREALRAAKTRLGLSGPEVDDLGEVEWAWGENGSPVVVGRGRPRALEDRVQEIAAAWDGVSERSQRDPALQARVAPGAARWRASLAGYRMGHAAGQLDTRAAVDDLGALGVSDGERKRIKDMVARASTHNDAVQEGRANVGDEPELVEYAKRWKAMIEQVKALDGETDKALGFVTGNALAEAERELNNMVAEWPLVKAKIDFRRKAAQKDAISVALKAAQEKERTGTAQGPAPGQAPTVVKVPDASASLPPSAATTAPAPSSTPKDEKSSPWTWAGVGAGALALGALALKVAVGAVVEEESTR